MARKKIPQPIRRTVKQYVSRLEKNGLPVQSAFIFGSYAKGNYHKWSDVDVCIISSALKRKRDPMAYLWRSKNNEDDNIMLAPVGFTPKDFVDESPLVWEIKRTGIRIK
ncbi:MAG: nucleotidyltransferase domain-containing protein [Candidatus Kerfeldbacteria bacterium]|nr:nucleotidyltransferase domain-containing protein [Candidatus Kerfeldbacteria bacterium]